MALDTKNPFLDALGGEPWEKAPQNTDATGALVLKYFFDQNTSPGPISETSAGNHSNSHSTGGAWTQTEKDQFFWAVSTWSNVANIRFVEVDNAAAANLIERKQTDIELTDPTIGSLTGLPCS